MNRLITALLITLLSVTSLCAQVPRPPFSGGGSGLPAGATGTLQCNGGSGLFAAATSCTFSTSLTGPLVVGGTGATASLTLRSTSGTGTTDAVFVQTGTDGDEPTLTAKQAGVTINGTTVANPLTVNTTDGSTQFVVGSTLAADEYPEMRAGATGVGATITAGTTLGTADVNLTLAGRGAGSLDWGNGDFLTPILRIRSVGTAQAAFPTVTRVLDSGSRVSLQLLPGTNGGIFTRITGGTPAGEAIGLGAVDLQLPSCTYIAARIASGTNSFTANCQNSATGIYSAAFGQSNTATGQAAFGTGTGNSIGGLNSVGMGAAGSDFSTRNTFFQGTGSFGGAGGEAQYRLGTFRANITATTATRLTTDAAAAGAGTTPFTLNANNRGALIDRCIISVCNPAACHTDWATYSYGPARATRNGGGTYSLSNTTVTLIESAGTLGTLAVTAAADDTNKSLNLSVTASDDANWYAVASCWGIDIKGT